MAQAKLQLRLYTVLFCVAVFFLTSAGLAVLYYGMLPSSLLLILVYIMAWALLFAFAVDFFGGKAKFSGKKVLVLALGVMLASTLFTHLVWTIATPKWSFSVSTDKSTYRLGEPVVIMASLRNMGFITHSFTSIASDPILFSIMYQYSLQVCYSRLHENITVFSLSANQSLERTFTWNQTNTANPWAWNQTYMPGTYSIQAFIPNADSTTLYFIDPLFSAWTSINITST
jgi:hypothetical protein